jgi:hypothetical protein
MKTGTATSYLPFNTQLTLGLSSIVEDVAKLSLEASKSMSQTIKKQFGGYYTPPALSEHMVNIANYSGGNSETMGQGVRYCLV